MRVKPSWLAPLALVCLLHGAGAGDSAGGREEPVSLRLIGMRSLPPAPPIGGAVIGGISGLDYDARADRWLAVSDDRVEHGPARFFKVRLDYDAQGFPLAQVEDVVALRPPDGSDYTSRPRFAVDRRGEVPDLEALRIDPRDGTVWHASEGDGGLGMNPWVRGAAPDGAFRAEWKLPPELKFDRSGQRGPRSNLTIEGIAFAPDGGSLWVALEAPLRQDGPVASAHAGAVTRFFHLGREGLCLAQVAYRLDAWQVAPAAGRLADNGVAEILSWPDGRLLVLERSGGQRSDGAWAYSARIYLADVTRAQNVAPLTSLAGAGIQPASKRLLFDFAHAGVEHIDNLEAMAWGRNLPNGHRTLVLASDDNFLPTQQTQFWVFEVVAPNLP